MGAIHKDTNLSIVRVPKIKVGNATTDLNDTVFQCTALVAIKDLHTAGINTRRILTLIPRLATIGRMVVTDRLHQIKVLIDLSLVDLRNRNDGSDSAFLWVIDLRNADAIAVVALGFQNEKSLLKNTGRNAKLPLNAGAYINGSFFRKLFLQDLCGGLRLILICCRVLIQQCANRRVIRIAEDRGNLIQRLTVFTQRTGAVCLKSTAFMLCNTNLHSQVSR